MAPLTVAEVASLALKTLPPQAADYIRSGARDEVTLRENRAAFGRWRLRHRVLVDVAQRTTAATVLGHAVRAPIAVAPTAFHQLAHPEGERATAAAAGDAGTVFCLSTLSNTPVEAVVEATTAPVFFQLYVYRDRGASRALVERVVAAGVQALVLTADAPILGTREADVRNRFRLPPGLDMPNATAAAHRNLGAAADGSALATWVAENLDAAVTWDDLAWLREVSGLPVVLKGVARADDARRAVDAGVAAVQVSNHGGRQLDVGVASLDALPEVVDAVEGRCEVWLDGGVRRGTDVLTALALGAQAVFVGRPVLYGLALEGRAGVAHVLEILRAELEEAMALAGAPTVREITRDLLVAAR